MLFGDSRAGVADGDNKVFVGAGQLNMCPVAVFDGVVDKISGIRSKISGVRSHFP